jgi:sialate O-acetylesterase
MNLIPKPITLLAALFTLSAFLGQAAEGALSLPHFFSDHMVLQREAPAAIWGTSAPNTKVSVSFKEEEGSTKSDADGRWRTTIETGKADAKGAPLTVQAGDQSVTIEDVLVGEVWLASGQSNMVFNIGRSEANADTVAKADYPGLRMFLAPMVTAADPQEDIEGEWLLASPETVPQFSAVAFFFARKLHEELGVPVGVIKSAWGGKPVETFTSRVALKTLPATKARVDLLLSADAKYDPETAQKAFDDNLAAWEAKAVEWRKLPKKERGKMAKRPTPPARPLEKEGQPGVLFDSMIHPFVGYTMRGAIWYQGEANAKVGAVPYDKTLSLLIRDWRERWDDDFSFYFVQLANFKEASTEPGTADLWALLQDRQRLVLGTTPKTGMAVINDVGEAKNIHPPDKQTPGERLARWALAKDYGQDILYSGPLFQSSKVKDGAVRITFDQAGEGLRARDDGPLQRFEIAGKDRVWHWAEATIDGKEAVLVSSSEVAAPVAVRYAWASNPEGANLVNSDDLPASIFRTDDWEDTISQDLLDAAEAKKKRLALAAEIKALNAKRQSVERGSDERKALAEKAKKLMEEYRAK